MAKISTSILMVLFLFVQNTTWANVTGSGSVAVPVLINPQNSQETYGGFISVDQTQQRPDALQILRRELQRQEQMAQQRAQRDGTFLSVTKRFPAESITFFIAIGAVTFNSMLIKSHGDPLAMERHIMSLKDPIAHISFYTFMQAQGFYVNFHTKGPRFNALDPSTKAQVMRRLSYQGMAIGSLASSIVADLGQSVTMCVDKWLKGKKDSQTLATCDQAWRNWNVRSKFTQYFPQIISMWVSQAATEFAEGAARNGFQKVSATNWARRILSKDFLVRHAYKITGADVVTTFAGGGWVTKSIKVLGKVTRFSGFVAIDHFLAGYTYPLVNNILLPTMFESDAINLDKLWHDADKGNWNIATTPRKSYYTWCDKVDCKTRETPDNITQFEDAVSKYSERMQQWREHLNSDAEQDLAGWLEMTKKLLSQVELAYTFYKNFVGELNYTLNTHYLVNVKKDLSQNAWNIASRFPSRPIPFYGVKHNGCRLMGSTNINDHYLMSPNELEACQKTYVLQTAVKFWPRYQEIKNSKAQDAKEFAFIISLIASNDTKKMAQGLEKINSVLAIYQMQMQQERPYSHYSIRYISILRSLKDALGNPRPYMNPLSGFAQIIENNSANIELKEAADYSLWSVNQKYKFNKNTDLLMYKLICGSNSANLFKIKFLGVNMVSPQFQPPTLLQNPRDRNQFCNSMTDSDNLYSKKIAGLSVNQYIYNHLNFGILGNHRGADPAQLDSFERWWQNAAKKPINTEFKSYDQKYRQVYNLTLQNFNGKQGWYKWAVGGLNQSMYLPKNIQNSLKAETNVYLQILNRVLLGGQVKVPTGSTRMPNEPQGWGPWLRDRVGRYSGGLIGSVSNMYKDAALHFDYMEYATRASGQSQFNSVYSGRRVGNIVELNNLMNRYHNFIINKNNRSDQDFEQYIALSKSVDTAINDILVIAGMKAVEQGASMTVDEFDFAAAPAATGHENSPKVYRDLEVRNPNYKQRMTIVAIKGLRQVESELKRFIRMKYTLNQTLELQNKEFMAEWNQLNPQPTRRQGFNPYGR